MPFHVGQQVTLLRPQSDEPYILTMQRYAVVAEERPSGYMIDLADAIPHRYGPFPAERLAHGWRDANGSWL